MFAATVLALLTYYVRLRTHQRLERLRLQDIRQRTELERALIAAKEVERLKDDLISTVSHELRTPLDQFARLYRAHVGARLSSR